MQLVRYEAARRALVEANRVDEAKDIRDKAEAMRVYALQARDRTLIMNATEIRLRAERRAGELLLEMPKNKGARSQSHPKTGGRTKLPPVDSTPKLSDLGVTKDQSSKWQKLAKLEETEFEQRVDKAVENGIAAIDRVERRNKVKTKTVKKEPKPKKITVIDRCAMAVRRLIFETLQEIQASEIDALFAEVRAEIDDLEAKAKD